MADTREIPGRFKPGVSGNPAGRPKRSTEEKYLKSLSKVVSLSDWREIAQKALDQAKRGDWRARQWISDYLIGKPVQGIDLQHDGTVKFIVEYAADGLSDNSAETA